MLKLIKTDGSTTTLERVIRMGLDARIIAALSTTEILPVYADLEAVRNLLSRILEKVDQDVQHL